MSTALNTKLEYVYLLELGGQIAYSISLRGHYQEQSSTQSRR